MVDALESETIRKTLFRRYILMLAPAAIIFCGWAACRQAGLAPGPTAITIIGPAAFITAIVLAVALPLFYRATFVRSVEGRKNVDIARFLSFQLGSMTMALLAPYAAAAGYVAGVSNFHFGGAFLASLYAAYYFFPSEKRIAQEMRLFRVSQTEEDS